MSLDPSLLNALEQSFKDAPALRIDFFDSINVTGEIVVGYPSIFSPLLAEKNYSAFRQNMTVAQLKKFLGATDADMQQHLANLYKENPQVVFNLYQELEKSELRGNSHLFVPLIQAQKDFAEDVPYRLSAGEFEKGLLSEDDLIRGQIRQVLDTDADLLLGVLSLNDTAPANLRNIEEFLTLPIQRLLIQVGDGQRNDFPAVVLTRLAHSTVDDIKRSFTNNLQNNPQVAIAFLNVLPVNEYETFQSIFQALLRRALSDDQLVSVQNYVVKLFQLDTLQALILSQPQLFNTLRSSYQFTPADYESMLDLIAKNQALHCTANEDVARSLRQTINRLRSSFQENKKRLISLMRSESGVQLFTELNADQIKEFFDQHDSAIRTHLLSDSLVDKNTLEYVSFIKSQITDLIEMVDVVLALIGHQNNSLKTAVVQGVQEKNKLYELLGCNNEVLTQFVFDNFSVEEIQTVFNNFEQRLALYQSNPRAFILAFEKGGFDLSTVDFYEIISSDDFNLKTQGAFATERHESYGQFLTETREVAPGVLGDRIQQLTGVKGRDLSRTGSPRFLETTQQPNYQNCLEQAKNVIRDHYPEDKVLEPVQERSGKGFGRLLSRTKSTKKVDKEIDEKYLKKTSLLQACFEDVKKIDFVNASTNLIAFVTHYPKCLKATIIPVNFLTEQLLKKCFIGFISSYPDQLIQYIQEADADTTITTDQKKAFARLKAEFVQKYFEDNQAQNEMKDILEQYVQSLTTDHMDVILDVFELDQLYALETKYSQKVGVSYKLQVALHHFGDPKEETAHAATTIESAYEWFKAAFRAHRDTFETIVHDRAIDARHLIALNDPAILLYFLRRSNLSAHWSTADLATVIPESTQASSEVRGLDSRLRGHDDAESSRNLRSKYPGSSDSFELARTFLVYPHLYKKLSTPQIISLARMVGYQGEQDVDVVKQMQASALLSNSILRDRQDLHEILNVEERRRVADAERQRLEEEEQQRQREEAERQCIEEERRRREEDERRESTKRKGKRVVNLTNPTSDEEGDSGDESDDDHQATDGAGAPPPPPPPPPPLPPGGEKLLTPDGQRPPGGQQLSPTTPATPALFSIADAVNGGRARLRATSESSTRSSTATSFGGSPLLRELRTTHKNKKKNKTAEEIEAELAREKEKSQEIKKQRLLEAAKEKSDKAAQIKEQIRKNRAERLKREEESAESGSGAYDPAQAKFNAEVEAFNPSKLRKTRVNAHHFGAQPQDGSKNEISGEKDTQPERVQEPVVSTADQITNPDDGKTSDVQKKAVETTIVTTEPDSTKASGSTAVINDALKTAEAIKPSPSIPLPPPSPVVNKASATTQPADLLVAIKRGTKLRSVTKVTEKIDKEPLTAEAQVRDQAIEKYSKQVNLYRHTINEESNIMTRAAEVGTARTNASDFSDTIETALDYIKDIFKILKPKEDLSQEKQNEISKKRADEIQLAERCQQLITELKQKNTELSKLVLKLNSSEEGSIASYNNVINEACDLYAIFLLRKNQLKESLDMLRKTDINFAINCIRVIQNLNDDQSDDEDNDAWNPNSQKKTVMNITHISQP